MQVSQAEQIERSLQYGDVSAVLQQTLLSVEAHAVVAECCRSSEKEITDSPKGLSKRMEAYMLFEIFNKEGNRVEWSGSKACLPGKSVFLARQKDGYIFKLDGKAVKTHDKLLEAVAESNEVI